MTEHLPATVYDAHGAVLGAGLHLDDDGTVLSLEPVAPDIRVASKSGIAPVIFPGFVDVHCHGGAGVSFPDAPDLASIARAIEVHASTGTLSLLGSLVSLRDPLPAITALADACDAGLLAGIHLEGPYLSPQKCGAQDPAAVRPIDLAELSVMLETGRGWVRTVTLAPELDGVLDAVELLHAAGARPSWGHTDDDGAHTRQLLAYTTEHGIRQTVTHLFNAMPGLHHRRPGPVLEFLAAARCGEAVVEVIGDGVHLAPELVRELLLSLDSSAAVALVSDAVSATGVDDGDHRLGALDVTLRDGIATLTGSDTLAGGTSTLGDQVRQLLSDGVPAPVLARAACSTPAHAVGVPEPGPIVVGQRFSGVLITEKRHRVWKQGRELTGSVQ